MPRTMDPDEVIEIVLKSDQAKPPEKQVTFVFRHLSAKRNREYKAIYERAVAAGDEGRDDDEQQALCELMALGLTAVRGCDRPAMEIFADNLTLEEQWELVIEYRRANILGSRDTTTTAA